MRRTTEFFQWVLTNIEYFLLFSWVRKTSGLFRGPFSQFLTYIYSGQMSDYLFIKHESQHKTEVWRNPSPSSSGWSQEAAPLFLPYLPHPIFFAPCVKITPINLIAFPDLFWYTTEFLLPQLSTGISYKNPKPNNQNPTLCRTHTPFLCDVDVKLLYTLNNAWSSSSKPHTQNDSGWRRPLRAVLSECRKTLQYQGFFANSARFCLLWAPRNKHCLKSLFYPPAQCLNLKTSSNSGSPAFCREGLPNFLYSYMNPGRGTSPSAPPAPFPVCSPNPKSHCSACISAQGLTGLSGGAAHDRELVASLPARCSRIMGEKQGSCCRESTKAAQATRQRHSLPRGTSSATLAVPQLKNLYSKKHEILQKIWVGQIY